IGSELAGYRIEAPIGRGGMGVVYRAEQLRLGRKVALKLLAPELAENEGFRARFEHESRLAAVLDHPNIVPLFEAGEVDGLLFISMRYVEGTDLRELLSRVGRLDPERALAIAAQVASALDAAHERGLVHRDVKPGNILIASDSAADRPEHCYLTDFGLTKDTSSPVELTATGTFVGTIDYIAPEQIEGATPAGRGDQYALACVLFECLTGHLPFARDEEISVMWAHLQDEPPTVTAVRPDLPAAIDAVIARALAKDPEKRYETCTAMVAAARAALLPDAVVPPAAVTRAHGSPIAPAGATRVNRANVAPPLAAPPLAAAPGAAAAPPLAAPTDERRGPAPAPPAPPSAGRAASGRRGPFLALGAAVVLAAAVAGALIGKGGADKPAPAAGKVAANDQVELTYKAPWVSGGDADVVPGLELTRPIVLANGDGRIVAGRIAKPGPGLLPDGVRVGATDAVFLGVVPALRHTGVPARGGRNATVFVVPTDQGPQAIVCTSVAASPCEAVAATLHLRSATALDVHPNQAYAAGLARLLRDQSERESADRRALAAARTGKAQGAAAASAAAHQAALAKRASVLAPDMPRAANDAVAAAIAGIARGYQRLSSAASAENAGRYRAAGAALRRAHADLAHAITTLKLLAYQIQRGG
ncbi:MAG: serine/threonine-protein kinase, partial [Solirubrobacteraceae bacterium]